MLPVSDYILTKFNAVLEKTKDLVGASLGIELLLNTCDCFTNYCIVNAQTIRNHLERIPIPYNSRLDPESFLRNGCNIEDLPYFRVDIICSFSLN